MDRIFATDELTKRERVERTLKLLAVDRVALHEQLSYNPNVISLYTGKKIEGFNYTLEDICKVIRKTLDMCFPPIPPRGKDRFTTADGFVMQNDEWTSWHVSRPFDDVHGARKWLEGVTATVAGQKFDPDSARAAYREEMLDLQRRIGDTVILNYSGTGFSWAIDMIGLELFVYMYADHPDVFSDYMEVTANLEIARAHAVADMDLSPVILIPEDFATKHGPIFPPEFLSKEHFPWVKKVAQAWKSNGITVLYHSDGNWKSVISQLVSCGVAGFYCLEPNVGMDIVELKNSYPELIWAGGVDGVDLMERGTPEQVRAEVARHVRQTNAKETGGMFVASSSEINPPIKPENFQAMVNAVGP